MSNNILKLIFISEVEKSKAEDRIYKCLKDGKINEAVDYIHYYKAFDLFIETMGLLLNAEAETNGEKDCKNDGNAV